MVCNQFIIRWINIFDKYTIMKKFLISVCAFCSISVVGTLNLSAQTLTTLGIGIASPQGTLHVHSATPKEDLPGAIPLDCGGLLEHNYKTVLHITNTNVGTTATDGFSITQTNNEVTLRQFENDKIHILGFNGQGLTLSTNGSLGVGTTSPSCRLHVNGNGYFNGTLSATSKVSMGADNQTLFVGKAHEANLEYGTAYLGFNAERNNGSWICRTNTWLNGGVVIWATMEGDLLFANIPSTGSSNQTGLTDASIKSNVNLKLSHDGRLLAKEVKVTITEWPDYVFDPQYKLLSISETKQFIEENGHLPEMPTAESIESEGMNVGEMNKLLVQKVEELTLYIIELQKQIDELKNKETK